MKKVFLLLCLCVFVFASETVALKDMKILSMSTRTNPAKGNENVCWVTVSDGETVYTAYQEKYAFGMVSCPTMKVGTVVQGGVSKNQKHLMLMLPHGDKTKQQNYVVTDMQAAQ